MKILTFCSFKGGTGKTSAALHIAAALAKFHDKKVLVVDFDSQANLSIGLGIGADELRTIGSVLQEELTIQDVIQHTIIKNLNLIPSNAYLDGIERTSSLMKDPYAHERLRTLLKKVKNNYDFCFIDTPPSLGWLTQTAFFAADHSVICAIPEAYSILALRRLKEFQDSIEKYHEISVLGVILSFWDERGVINKDFLNEINHYYPSLVFNTKIRRDIVVSRSVLKGTTVFESNKEERAGKDYKKLTQEFLERINKFCIPYV